MENRVVFMGTPDFAVPVLQQLVSDGYNVVAVVTQPDRPKGRKRTLSPPPVKVAAVELGIPVIQPEKIKNEYEPVLAYNPDIIVTAAFGQILPKVVLDAPKFGCINVHASVLPELRGGAPIHYSIIQGKKETGVSIMYMVEALDAGDVLSQVKVPILEEDHVGTLHDKLSEAGAKLLSETLPKVLNKKIEAIAQNDDEATYAYNIKRDEEKIDWSRNHMEIYNFIRGLHPWPVASTTWNGTNVKIWWGEKVEKSYTNEPGVVVEVKQDGFIVACGNGKGIKVTEIQPAGKKRMDTESFLRGAGSKLQVGDKLGD